MADKIIISDEAYRTLVDYMAYRQLLNAIEAEVGSEEYFFHNYVLFEYASELSSSKLGTLSRLMDEDSFLQFLEIFGDKEGLSHDAITLRVLDTFTVKGKLRLV